MKKATLLLIVLIVSETCIHNSNKLKADVSIVEEKVKENKATVTITMYNATSGQCDDTPFITADGSKISKTNASKQKMVALSRNLLSRWGGKFNYGDMIKISGTDGKDGTYRVCDSMNKRIKNTVDILEDKGVSLYKFKNVTITKVS